MIVTSAYDLNLPHVPREQRIDDAEDRAEQAWVDVEREARG